MGKPTICIGENKDADQLRGKSASNFILLIVPRRYFCGGSFVLCLGVYFFLLLAPYVCFHILVEFR